MSRYDQGTEEDGKHGRRRQKRHAGVYPRRTVTLPPVTSPNDAPAEVDHRIANKSGSRSRKRVPKPLRFFPQIFPVPTTLYGIITIVGAVLLIGAMFFEVRQILSPFLLAGAVAILLYPFRHEPKLRPLMVAAGVIFLVWFTATTINLLIPFILAFLAAYMVEPLVSAVSKRWYVQRWVSALLLTLVFLVVVVLSAGYVVPVLIAQIGGAVASFESTSMELVKWARDGGLRAITGIPQEKIDSMIQEHLIPKLEGVDAMLITMIGNIGVAVPNLLTTFINFLMIPFVMFYFIKDYWKIRASLYSFLPQEYQRKSHRFLRDMDEIVGGYLRGDIITSIFQALFIGLGLYFIGVPGAVLLGLLSGFLNLIPLIGAYIAYAFAAVAALGAADPFIALIWVTALFLTEGILETAIIGPQVFGRHTDMHPLMVIISIFVFGYFLGIGGMLIAIPVTSLALRFATRWRDERRVAIEQQKVEADLKENPHHARKGDLAPAPGA